MPPDTSPPRKKQRKDVPEDQEVELEHDAGKRACDECRSRRVRCDKLSPCSNCKSRGSACRTSINQNSEPRSRVNITKEYENKIDLMAKRLASIEELLRRRPPTPASSAQGYISEDRSDPGAHVSVTEGISPFASSTRLATRTVTAEDQVGDATTGVHSAAASAVVEQAIQRSSEASQNVELSAALHALKDMVASVGDAPSSREIPASSWATGPIEPTHAPSQAEIEMLVDRCEASITLGFSAGLTVSLLREKCESVFASSSRASVIRRVYVYGTLRNLCTEYTGRPDPVFAARCHELSDFFSVQLGDAVNDLKLIVPPTAEAASALTMAAGAAVDLCKPLVAHSLSSKAASVVLSLGYNNWSSMRSDTEDERQSKMLTFWMVYWLDTSCAVRLGRAPVIQHYDITVPPISKGSIVPSSWVIPFNYSTKISGLQYRVVQQLYNPVAVQQSAEERAKRAARLLQQLNEAWDARGEVSAADAHDDGLHLLLRDSDAVIHHSTVCLVQHATSSLAKAQTDALESAREALRLNNNAWRAYSHLPDFIWSGHCSWTLLKGPITPFVVIFCHVIARPFESQPDLALLTDFVATLQELCRFSDGMVKMHRLCDVFCKVAALYIQAKDREAGQGVTLPSETDTPALDVPGWLGQPAVDDIDGYLSAIGFVPPPDSAHAVPGAVEHDAEFDGSLLMDWYQGNNALMGFLEQDMVFTGEQSFDYMQGGPLMPR